MATSPTRKTSAKHSRGAAVQNASQPSSTTTVADASLDATLDTWSDVAARELLAWEIGSSTALLRTAEALHEAQLEAARKGREAAKLAADELAAARGAAEMARVQLALAQSDGQAAFQCLSRIGEAIARQAADSWAAATSGVVRLQGAASTAAVQWLTLQAHLPATAEALEAEVEHVTSPLTASPFVWPAQEAARQAMTLANSTWNDWLSWSGQWAEANRAVAGAASHAR